MFHCPIQGKISGLKGRACPLRRASWGLPVWLATQTVCCLLAMAIGAVASSAKRKNAATLPGDAAHSHLEPSVKGAARAAGPCAAGLGRQKGATIKVVAKCPFQRRPKRRGSWRGNICSRCCTCCLKAACEKSLLPCLFTSDRALCRGFAAPPGTRYTCPRTAYGAKK
jgi:hypothetical protein